MTETKDMPSSKALMRLPRGRTILILMAGVLVLVLIGRWSMHKQDELMRSALLSEARIAAKAINWRNIQSLTASDADLSSQDYQRLKEQLTSIRSANPHYRFTYLLGQHQDKSVFIFIDSEQPDSKDYSPPGQLYTEAPETFRQIFATGHESVVGPVEDRWGTWVSALVPITDPHSGKLVALFGMDREAGNWNVDIALEVAEQMALILLLIALLAVFLMLRQRDERSKEILQNKNSFLSSLLSAIPVPVFYKDNQGRYLGFNKAYEDFFGMARPELIGKSVFDIAPKELAEIYHAKDLELFQQSGLQVYESHVKNAQGGIHDVIFHKAAFTDIDGHVCGLIGAILDITERKRAMEELKQSEEKFRTLFEMSPYGIAVMNLKGEILMCNMQAAVMHGYERPEEMTRISMFELMTPKSARDVADSMADFVSDEGQIILQELSAFKRDGSIFPIEVSVRLLRDAELMPSSFLAIGKDISERKQTEEEVRRLTNDLEMKVEERTRQLVEAQEELVRKEKLAILGQLSGSVGHELRNPLGVMSNAVYFLKMVHADGDETTKEYLDMIKQEIDTSQRIISDLLDFARTKTPQTTTVSVRKLLDDSLAKCVIPENVMLQIMLPDILPLLKVDPLQMGQVFENLISNAVQAMPDGGSLQITAQNRDRKDFIEISVSDTGGGIAPENMKRLFQPLFTTKPKGIGLGLVVCRNLVEANGGRIEVANKPGERTTFTVTLPASAGAE